MSSKEGDFIKTVLCALNAKYTHSSLALLYLKKYNSDKDIRICEYTINDSIWNIYKGLLKEKANVYGFSCYIWNIEQTLKIAEMIKKAMPECTVFLGGPEASYNYSNLLNIDYIDYIMLGEGEQTLKDFLENITSPNTVSGLAGKNFCNRNSITADLSKIPLPYSKEDLNRLKDKIIYFETSRGCPFKCTYCLSSAETSIRYFPMEYVKNGFDLFFQNNVPLVKLVDRTFNANKKRAIEIISYIIQNAKNTCVHFEVAPHLLDDEIIGLLSTAPKGMFQLEMGIQSTNIQTLNSINRNINMDIVAENIKKISAAKNMHIHLDLIAGLPYEDFDSFEKSFNYVYALSPGMLQLGFLKVLHGTKIKDNYDIVYSDFPPYEVIKTKWISADEICKLKGIDQAVDRFYNNGGFNRTLKKLNRGNAFLMFIDISNLINNEKGNLSKSSLYSLLYSKYKDDIIDELTLDFLENNRDTKLPSFINVVRPNDFKKTCYALLKDEAFLKKYKVSSDLKTTRIEAVNGKVIIVDYSGGTISDITEYFKF